MKIVHTEASCGWGGQEIRIIEESLGMMQRGHEVVILCPPESRIYSEAPKRGVSTVALPIGRKKLRGMLAMRRWLSTNRADVVNTHSSTDSWLVALACATLPSAPPVVRTRHISAPIADNGPTRWLYTRATHHIVTTGEALRQELIQRNGFPEGMITSVPTGIDTQRFCPGDKPAARRELGLDPEGHYLGIVATLRSWKGHLYLLDALAQLDQPGWSLIVVGDGPMREVLQAKVTELGLAERVRFVGQQANPETWLRALDIFCLPSYANEGVPQAILQAMLTALPIVTTPVGAITEAVSDGATGRIVPARDSQVLAQALNDFIQAPERAQQYGLAALNEGRRRFSREIMLDRMESIFGSLCEPART